MKDIKFLLAEQVAASSNPLSEIDGLRSLLDGLEKIYIPRERVYNKIRPDMPWWKKRWAIHWHRPSP